MLRFEAGRRSRELYIAGFCFGLACSNHAQIALIVFGFLAFVVLPAVRRDVLRPRTLLLLSLSFLAGFQVLSFLKTLSVARCELR